MRPFGEREWRVPDKSKDDGGAASRDGVACRYTPPIALMGEITHFPTVASFAVAQAMWG